jgi:dCMP deaminase
MNDKFITAHMWTAFNYAKLSSAKKLKVGAIIVKDNRIISIGYNGTPAGWDNNCESRDWAHHDVKHSAVGFVDSAALAEEYPFVEHSDVDAKSMIGRYKLQTKPEVIHAESNAITKLAKCNESGQGAAMFITHAPCINCAKLIHQTEISEVYFNKKYRSTDGIEFLNKCDIRVEQIFL